MPDLVPYLVILAAIAFLLWLKLERSFWLTSLLVSILLSWLTVSATNLCFPFWKIYLPQTGVLFAFTLIWICLPITTLNIMGLNKIIGLIKQTRNHKKEYLFIFVVIALCFAFFGFGVVHNAYQSIPANNLNLYFKDREYIVSLIKAGTLHGGRNCMQNLQLDESESQLDECREEIELPDKYKGLSRNGKVYLTKTPDRLSISFMHSTYNFGDGSRDIVYSSSDNALSKPQWKAN